MKILAICADINPGRIGGAEAHFIEVLKRIAPKLEKVTVLVGGNTGVKNLFTQNHNIEFVRVHYPHIPNLYGLFYILFATPIALFLTKQDKYDIIWAKQEYPQAQVGATVKFFTKLPLYVTTQNPNLGTEELVGVGGSLVSFFVSHAFHLADSVAAVSNYSANLAKKLGAKRIVVIPNGIDLSKYPEKKTSSKIFRIVTTSSLIPRNGIDTLIKACAGLDIDYDLTIAGDGPLRSDLENLAIKLGIINRVKFLGRVSPDLVPGLLATSHLFVRPSRAEGFGNSFVEAMAAGIPVIGTPTGGIVDFLVSGVTGLMVPVDNPKELTFAIEKIYHEKAFTKKLVTNALKKVQDYDWDLIAPKVLKEMYACL